ncbi:MAG: hypothetical protein IKZ90_09470 [Clostridiales bacterium]|nr:hypothetical protein [Clostridiales bacterium]
MKEETTKIPKQKKGIFGKYRTTIVLTTVLFLLFACVITYWAVNERKNIISDADAVLQDRKEQLVVFETIRAASSSNIIFSSEDGQMVAVVNGEVTVVDSQEVIKVSAELNKFDQEFLSEAKAHAMNVLEEDMEQKVGKYKIGFFYWQPEYDQTLNYRKSSVILWPDNSRYCLTDKVHYYIPGSFAYEQYGYSRPENGLGVFDESTFPLNAASFSNQVLWLETNDLIQSADPSGSFEGYRYLVFVRPGSVINASEYINAGNIDIYNVPSSQYSKFAKVILFEDVSAPLKALAGRIVKYSSIALVIVLLAAVISFLLEKNLSADLLPVPETSADQAPSAGKSVLSKDAAKGFLAKIDRVEQSMGPNGYLDEIRQDLEKILGKDTKKEE